MKTLHLAENQLTSIPKALDALTNLQNLILTQNKLATLSKNQFKSNSELILLNLGFNELTTIEDCTFCKLPHLKDMYLSNNQKLSFIHENAFGFVSTKFAPALEYFSAKHCNLATLPSTLLNWNNTKHVLIGFNPFTCDSTLTWLLNVIKNSSSPYHAKFAIHYGNPVSDEYVCFNPPALKGCLFSNVSAPLGKPDCLNVNDTGFSNTQLLFIIISLIFAAFSIISAGIYVYRRRIRDIPYRRRQEEDDKIEEDFDSNDV